MSIIDRQLHKRIDQALEETLKSGKIPTSGDIKKVLKLFVGRMGGPIFRPPEQKEFAAWDIAALNRELPEVEFDLNVLKEEVLATTLELMRRTTWAEAVYRGQFSQARAISNKLSDLLFGLRDSDHFPGISCSMDDITLLDQSVSTVGVVDLDERAALIPPSAIGTERIKLVGIDGLVTVTVLSPERDSIAAKGTANDASAENLFVDTLAPWRYDVTTTKSSPVTIRIEFPLGIDNRIFDITRLSLTPSSERVMKATILYSNDGINFQQLPGGSSDIFLSAAAIVKTIDFERTGVRKIRVELTKDEPDEVLGNFYRYSFGLRTLAIYMVSRPNEATYQTKPIVLPTDFVQTVALEVVDVVPAGTAINYFVSDETGDFLPISPLNSNGADNPKEINYGGGVEGSAWLVANPSGEIEVDGITLYSVTPDIVSGELLFGSKLYRGAWCWSQAENPELEVRKVTDVFIDFASSDTQSIYRYTEVAASDDDVVNALGEDVTVLTVVAPIFYRPRVAGHLMIPEYGINIDNDSQPRYAIANISAIVSDYGVTGEALTISKSKIAELNHRNVDETTRPVVTYSSTELVEGVDYALGKWSGTDYLDGTIWLLDNPVNVPSESASVTVTYQRRMNITHLVRNIYDDTNIELAHTITANKFVVTYRTVVDDLVTNSVVVKQKRGLADGNVIYSEGPDYQLNIVGSIIRRMSGGAIPATSPVCYLDFQYAASVNDLYLYSAWCQVDSDIAVVIKTNGILLDKDGGEKFILDTETGSIDLTDAKNIPPLKAGVYRFSVISKHYTDSDSAILKVLGLLDTQGNAVFAGTEYFSKLSAFKDPMKEISLVKLKYGIDKYNHTVFAMNDGKVYVNFEPGVVDDIITLRYDENTDTILEEDETFRLYYFRPGVQAGNIIRLKAVLSRLPGVDPGLTPKIYSWSIRLKR